MASLEQLGRSIRAVVRQPGGKKISYTFDSMAEAEDWAAQAEKAKDTLRTRTTLITPATPAIGMPGGIDIEALARQIAVRMDPEALMDAEDVSAYLKCSIRYLQEQFAPTPGFPKSFRLTCPDGRRSNARWRRQDITAWVNSHIDGKSKLGGRPRNPIRV